MKQSIPNQQEQAPRHADDYNELEKKGSGTSRQGPSDYEKKSSPPGKSSGPAEPRSASLLLSCSQLSGSKLPIWLNAEFTSTTLSE